VAGDVDPTPDDRLADPLFHYHTPGMSR
jgi:hypothetical protein